MVVRRVLKGLPGLVLQPKSEQSRFKISYYYDAEKAPSVDEINRLLHQEEQAVNVILSFGQFLDVLPIRASKGLALRYLAAQWDLPLEHILVAGGSGADEDMMRGNTLGVVVGNRHNEELSQLADLERIAKENGFTSFSATVLRENRAMLHVFKTRYPNANTSVIGGSDIGRISGQGHPPERTHALAHERPQVGGHDVEPGQGVI